MTAYPRKVLVVEDDRDHAFLIQKALERWAADKGCAVEVVYTAEDALKKIQRDGADIVLADYRLPGRSGLDLLEDLNERKIHVPVVLLTAVGSEELAAKALKAGCFDYLAKSEHYIQRLAKVIEDAYERYLKEAADQKKREELTQSHEELISKNKKLAELSVLDDLTGLYNHRFLHEKFSEELARAKRYHSPLACLMIDIDHFKNVNDTYGHQAGDAVLKELARFFLEQLREADTVARYGGEEFCILLPHTDCEGASNLAERLRKKVIGQDFGKSFGQSIKIAISIGISSYPEDPVDQKDTMIFYADKALYKAKSSGRNRVVLYQSVVKEYSSRVPVPQVSDREVMELRQRLSDISERAKRAFIEATETFVCAIEEKHGVPRGHASRVSRLCFEIGNSMGFGGDDVGMFQHAGLLHDIGKACLDDSRLKTQELNTANEYENAKVHAVLGFQIVKPIKFLSEEASIILHHHERYDGRGYPHHLKGREIPAGARILAVAGAFDTMRNPEISDRKPLALSEAADELISGAGTQFDPEVVNHLVQILVKKGELKLDPEDEQVLQQALKSAAV